MNYGNIKFCDIADGAGVRTSLFVSGCNHRCRGCFNPETWDFLYGSPFDKDAEDRIIESCRPSYIAGLTLLGGEPMEPDNQRALLGFVRRFREELPGKTVWCYTGCSYEQLTGAEDSPYRCEVTDELLRMTDILVDGEFIEEMKNITLRFKGSSNQRILDVKRSLEAGTPVLWEDDPCYTSHSI